MRGIFAGGLSALALCGPAFAGPILDGNVADWGIAIADGNDSNFSNPAVAGTQHSLIEPSVERSIFGAATALGIYWAPGCGKDVLEINGDLLPARVPAPAAHPLLALGLLGTAGVRRRR